jgi:carbapenam-3-carboxylate synthase
MSAFFGSYDPCSINPATVADLLGTPAASLEECWFGPMATWTTRPQRIGMGGFAVRTCGGLFAGHGDYAGDGCSRLEDSGPDEALTWCRDVFHRFAGAWCERDRLLLWTDPQALCPAFYAFDPAGGPVFASEAKVLLGVLPATRELGSFDGRALPGEGETLFRGILSVPPGTVVTLVRSPGQWRRVSQKRYFHLPDQASETLPDEAQAEVAKALEASVESAVGDLEQIGIPLSGGVDSSAVAVLARPHVRNLATYTIGTPYADEFAQAREVAHLLGSDHHQLVMNAEDLKILLPHLIWAMETWDPLTLQIAAPTAFLYQMLRFSTCPAVFLTGYGADLIFGGTLDGRTPESVLEDVIRQQVALTVPTNEFSPVFASHHGITVRHPFWTTRMLEVGLRIRARLKLRDGHVKWVLRHAAERHLPHHVAWRQKRGIHEGSAMGELLAEALGTSDPPTQLGLLRGLAYGVLIEGTGSPIPIDGVHPVCVSC